MGPDHRPGINSIVCIYIYVCVEFVGTLDSISFSFSQFLVFSSYNFYSCVWISIDISLRLNRLLLSSIPPF